MTPKALLQLNHVTVTVREVTGAKTLLDRIDFEIPELSITALVGASGSGKTTAGLAILRLLPTALEIQSGQVIFNGEDLLKASTQRMRQVRGGAIGMVFQEPLNAFNPVFTVGYQIE